MTRRSRYVPCLAQGCGELVDGGGYCEAHARPAWQHTDRRGRTLSRHERGYDSRWEKRRAIQLAKEPNCRRCGKPAVTVDHIVPKADGGSDAWANLQSLCADCHARKSAREGGRAAAAQKR